MENSNDNMPFCNNNDEFDSTINNHPLGIVMDIDGTLIRESRHLTGIRIRPHVVEFLVWCRQQGHRLALWTAGDKTWADRVLRKLCPLVQEGLGNGGVHDDCPHGCRLTFDFCWGGDRMRQERPLGYGEILKRKQQISRGVIPKNQCHWCEFYKDNCRACQCYIDPNQCFCRGSKDLRKVWYNQDEETLQFHRERTLLVENMPQNCRYNYGNAIYVPTYRGSAEDSVFAALQVYIAQVLEQYTDVRYVCKCHHPKGAHACLEQSWWNK
ncbi:expressed unknown protein [Seminavis robusta]|uniref:Mitochondrial import inner membrane translocase subunit TIM50 n=1 Tax=Seminavis robusta TaxID=568900 RepID=A0A9N8H462_9STRA|nr:expressed unknown protein [Seminavis robusta]|eukprot:Sro77_g042070.1 n/a (268) ;mRNA; f:64897-65700